MKKVNSMRKLGMARKKQGGFIMSMDFWLAIGLATGFAMTAQAKGEMAQIGKEENQLTSDVVEIVNAARNYKKTVSNGYASVSMTVLSANSKFISASYADGSGKSPFQGSYTVAGSGNNVVVTATSLPTNTCETQAALFNKRGVASCSTGTLTVTTY